jgi:hypothetical protein
MKTKAIPGMQLIIKVASGRRESHVERVTDKTVASREYNQSKKEWVFLSRSRADYERRILEVLGFVKIKIWTRAYRPLMVAGDPHTPVACMVEATGPYLLGSGYQGYVVMAPNGQTYVAERHTGALVGPDLETVRKDILTADHSVMDKQLADAAVSVKRASVLSADEFWKLMRQK